MIDNYLKNTLKTSKKLPEAFPAYPEIANKPVCHEKRQLLIRKLRFTLNYRDAAKCMKSLYKCSKTCLYRIFAFLEIHVKSMREHSKQNKLFQGHFFNRGRAWVIMFNTFLCRCCLLQLVHSSRGL